MRSIYSGFDYFSLSAFQANNAENMRAYYFHDITKPLAYKFHISVKATFDHGFPFRYKMLSSTYIFKSNYYIYDRAFI